MKNTTIRASMPGAFQLPVKMTDIDAIVTRVEQKCYATMEGEIPTEQIGDLVMAELKELNDVAYVRFASVYRQFKDVNSFMDELQRLIQEK